MLPSRGRPGLAIMMEIDRPLTAEDIMRLATDPNLPKTSAPILQTLKDRHHAIARYLASGRTVVETAALCGLTPQRVSDLERNDPAFRHLLGFYRSQIVSSGIDEAQEFRGKLRDIGRMALEELQDRLVDDKARKEMDVDQLRRTAEMALDRTDAPPRTAQATPPAPTHITFNMGPRTLGPKTIEINERSENPVIINEELSQIESFLSPERSEDTVINSETSLLPRSGDIAITNTPLEEISLDLSSLDLSFEDKLEELPDVSGFNSLDPPGAKGFALSNPKTPPAAPQNQPRERGLESRETEDPTED